jgi:hypothetical protein
MCPYTLHVQSLMMETETFSKRLHTNSIFTHLIARKDSVTYSHRVSLNSYEVNMSTSFSYDTERQMILLRLSALILNSFWTERVKGIPDLIINYKECTSGGLARVSTFPMASGPCGPLMKWPPLKIRQYV